MADIKFSEFPKATTSKDSDEIAILQDGVNKMIASPVLESKIINKTVSRVIEQGGASLNVINLKGVVPTYADLALITPAPSVNDAYQVEADGLVYVYTDTGFQAEGDGFIVQPQPTGVIEEGNTQAVSGGEVFNSISNSLNISNDLITRSDNKTLPLRDIIFNSEILESDKINIKYFYNRELFSGSLRTNLILSVSDELGVEKFEIYPAVNLSGYTILDKDIIKFNLIANKPGNPIHGKIVGSCVFDLNLSYYGFEAGYGLYNVGADRLEKHIVVKKFDNSKLQSQINTANNNINLLHNIDDSPFVNTPTINSMSDAILDVEIYPDIIGNFNEYALISLWRNSAPNGGMWFVRVQGQNSSGTWVNLGDWSKTTYVPTADVERIKVNNGAFFTIDWTRVPDNTTDNNRYILKKSASRIIKNYEDWVLIPDSAPDFINNAVVGCNALTETFNEFSRNDYALCYIWKNRESAGNIVNLIRFGREIDDAGFTDNYRALQWSGVQADEIKTYQIGEFRITIDWSKIPDNTAWNGRAWFKNILTPSTNKIMPESFSSRDTIENIVTVKKDGSGDFTTIQDAYDSIIDSSFTKQYEICVYPGLYEENNLIPPPFTHTHGLAPNTVIVSSKPWQGINTLPVFDQMNTSSKLSNMTIESWTGYCIHFDVGLNKQTIFNENLRLRKVDFPGVASDAIIGGGSFKYGTKFVWKSCIFEDGQALCHTNGNVLNENVHLIFEDCSFINAWAGAGSVGGFGHCVAEIRNCNFIRGLKSFISWNSPIRNIDDPTLYLFNSVEWQVLGSGNKNFAPSMPSSGKTIQLTSTTDIQISGTAASVIFGNMPTRRKKGTRFDASLTSMYHIFDAKAGLDGYSARTDVFQLWKRLGDCSVINKTLTVEAQGETKTYTFNQDYLTSKKAQNTIISEMQAVLTNVTIGSINYPAYSYESINTSEKAYIKVTAPDVLRMEIITKNGAMATNTTALKDIAGVVLNDGVLNESVPVWSGAIWTDTVLANGEYGVSNGNLSLSETNKIGEVINGCFYPYY